MPEKTNHFCILTSPPSKRLEVAKVTRAKEWEFESVLRCIHDELLAREQCKFVGKASKPDHADNISGASLHSFAGHKRINCCVYCGDNHKAWECNKITDVSK